MPIKKVYDLFIRNFDSVLLHRPISGYPVAKAASTTLYRCEIAMFKVYMVMKNNPIFILVTCIAALSFVASVCSAEVVPGHTEIPLPVSKPEFVIGFETIKIPAGRLLLVRTKNQFCAVKIEKSGTISVKDQQVNYTDFQLSRVAKGGSVHTKNGRFALEGTFGLGHWTWDRGNTLIKCDGHRIAWYFPNEFSISGKAELAVAPTAWTAVAEVRLDDPRLQWFEADPSTKRATLNLPVSSLPGAQ